MEKNRFPGHLAVRLIVLSAIVGVFFLSLNLYNEINKQKGKTTPLVVEVKKGQTLYELSVLLEKEGVIRSATLFRLFASSTGVDKNLLPGEYKFPRNIDNKKALEIIKEGPRSKNYKVLIPEGWNVKQIAKRMSKVAGVDEQEFLLLAMSKKDSFAQKFPFLKENNLNNLEGYLFPKTYEILENSSPETIIEIMLSQFSKEIEGIDFSKMASQGYNLHEVLTVASLLEREAKVPEERHLIASVIYNRLKKGMKLQMCATVQYALGKNKPFLSTEDLKIDSLYNTYLYSGLPPGPICNPGKASIEAAANPAETNFLYYVLATKEGKHEFAATYDEFLKAKRKYKNVFNLD